MFGLLALLLLVVPIAELYVIIQVAQGIGGWNTIAVLIAVSMLGAWLVKREGLGLLARIQTELHEGRVPAASVADGFLILFAGALLLTPGFLTDLVGVLLLLPPVRAVVRRAAMRRFRTTAQAAVFGTGPAGGPAGAPTGGRARFSRWVVYDARSTPRDGEPDPPRDGPSEPPSISPGDTR